MLDGGAATSRSAQHGPGGKMGERLLERHPGVAMERHRIVQC